MGALSFVTWIKSPSSSNKAGAQSQGGLAEALRRWDERVWLVSVCIDGALCTVCVQGGGGGFAKRRHAWGPPELGGGGLRGCPQGCE